jgi:EAL domain-containing protein (putative c-di-GMP-specific phosphodiesterase class I)
VERFLTPETQRLGLEQVVELAQRYLGVDAVFVAELTSDGEVFRAVAGDTASFQIALDARRAGAGTYSERLVTGEIPNVICDAAHDPRVAHLPITRETPVGSFVGVPLRLTDGTLFGTFCCLNHKPDPGLSEREVRFISMLAELLVEDLDRRRTQQQLRGDILGLIAGERVDVAYQPIFDLHTDRCLGVEALARFPEPFTRPDQTFAAAEGLGLGLELEELVVRQAWTVLSQLAEGQFLALNLTPRSLLQLARRANRRQEVPLSALVVEITEHTAINAYADLRRELERLRERGLRIAVDDAGAGYASLRHVLELRPDIVKIDRSLIHGLANDRARRITVSAFVSLARDFGSTVVAEGVEVRADLDTARELGIDAAQGYLLGRPSIDPNALNHWIHAATTRRSPTGPLRVLSRGAPVERRNTRPRGMRTAAATPPVGRRSPPA